MIKYKDTYVVFEEIPDKVSLAINITNCQNHCIGCHSPELRCDTGIELTIEELDRLIRENEGINCVVFMGEGHPRDREEFISLAKHIMDNYPSIYTAVYSGRESVEDDYISVFDYIKTGPYIEKRGPLNSRTTNQKLIMYNHPRGKMCADWLSMDITYKFWDRK